MLLHVSRHAKGSVTFWSCATVVLKNCWVHSNVSLTLISISLLFYFNCLVCCSACVLELAFRLKVVLCLCGCKGVIFFQRIISKNREGKSGFSGYRLLICLLVSVTNRLSLGRHRNSEENSSGELGFCLSA